jgi:ABC-type Fe3+-siderophore transport system permease subunit
MSQSTDGSGRLLLSMTLFVLVGMPLVYVAWESLNDLLAGEVTARELGEGLVALLLLIGLLVLLRRSIARWNR